MDFIGDLNSVHFRNMSDKESLNLSFKIIIFLIFWVKDEFLKLNNADSLSGKFHSELFNCN